jgi:hypothetical protein
VSLSANFSVNGSVEVVAHETTFGATVNLQLLSLSGVRSIQWTIGDPDSEGSSAGTSHVMEAPTITPAGAPTGATASFTMVADPGDGEGRAVTVKCKVTGQNGATAVAYRIVGVPNAAGIVPLAVGEELFRHPTLGWTQEINTALAGNHTINVRTFGATGDGATDDTAAIATTLARGGVFYFPEGDYLIAGAGADAGGVLVELTSSLKVECHPNARFFTDTLDNDFFRFTVPSDGDGLPDEKITFEWVGGIFDMRDQRVSTVVPFIAEYPPVNAGTSATCDGVSISGSYTVTMSGSPNLTFAEVGALGDTITRSAGSWITDGFAPGDTFTVEDSVSNNVTGRIASLSATVLTLAGTDLVNEGPVGGVTVTATKTGIAHASIRDVRFIAGDHWETAGGDSGIVIGDGCDRSEVTGCTFVGCRDLGIYASNDGTGLAGGTITIARNTFINCMFGAAVKRQFRGFTVRDNTFVNCVSGFNANVVNEYSSFGLITGNHFRACSYFVRLDGSTNVHIHGNYPESLGATLEDGTTPIRPYAGGVAAGYWLRGATYCTVQGERCLTLEATHGTSGNLVYLDDFADVGPTIISEYNLIADCISNDFGRVVEEPASMGDNNRIERCYNYGSVGARDPQTNGASTTVIRWVPASNRWSFEAGVLSGDGSAAAPAIARRADPQIGFYFAAGELLAAVGGSERWSLSTSEMASQVAIRGPAGNGTSTPSYAFNAETSLGMYRDGSGRIGWASGGAKRMTMDASQLALEVALVQKPAASVTPANNGELMFEATNNTTITVKFKGSDGTVRSVALTLA